MKITRKFTYVGAVRKFRVKINEEVVTEVKVNKTQEVPQPEGHFTIQVETMKLEKSKKYVVKTDKEINIITNVNPMFRLFFAGYMIAFLTAFIFVPITQSLPIILGLLVVYILGHYGYFKNRYMYIKAFDEEGTPIELIEI